MKFQTEAIKISLASIAISILIISDGYAQEFEITEGVADGTGEYFYQGVYEVAEDVKLYDQTKLWVSTNFRSSKAVIDNDDANLIVIRGVTNGSDTTITQEFGKGRFANKIVMNIKKDLEFKMTFEFKGNKVRCTITDVSISLSSNGTKAATTYSYDDLMTFSEQTQSSMVAAKQMTQEQANINIKNLKQEIAQFHLIMVEVIESYFQSFTSEDEVFNDDW